MIKKTLKTGFWNFDIHFKKWIFTPLNLKNYDFLDIISHNKPQYN